MAREAWYINESELDDYQIPIVQKKIGSSFIVQGCAGSGKTVLALWKARKIADRNLGSFYVVVYTRALRQFLNDGVGEIGLSENRVVYYNLWKYQLNKPRADFVIVDEAQDFTKEELTDLQKSANKAFILFGDTDQQVYKDWKDVMRMEDIAHHTKLKMESLVLNHRLPKTIARVVQYLNTTGDRLESRCTKEGSNKPYLANINSVEKQLDFIKNTIEERSYTDVAILFCDNQSVKMADEYFKKSNFLVEAKYGNRSQYDEKFNLNFDSENPKLMTYHSAKGLQFEAVFVPECTMDNLHNKKNDYRNALYVALTRAYQDLFILYSDKLINLLDKVPENLFEIVDGNDEQSEFDDDLPI